MKNILPIPDSEYLNSVLEYRNGKLYWKKSPNSKRKTGDLAGSSNKDWYCTIGINGKRLFQHRVIWTMFYGQIPQGCDIDHVNRDKHDNRIENLRAVSRSCNLHNKDSKNIRITKSGRYEAYIEIDGRRKSKNFQCLKDAEQWIIQKKQDFLLTTTNPVIQ